LLTGKNLVVILCILLAAGPSHSTAQLLGTRSSSWTIKNTSPRTATSRVTPLEHHPVGLHDHLRGELASADMAVDALDYQLFGLNPAGHHFDSLLIHALNSCFCFCCWPGYKARGAEPAGGSSVRRASLNVESVAWVAERRTS